MEGVMFWDGNEWCGCGSTFDGEITVMTHYRDTLYIADGFKPIEETTLPK